MNDTTFQGDGKIAFVPVVVNAKQPKQTNADRIRAMTDEELANMMAHGNCGYCKIHDYCFSQKGVDCDEAWLNWLKEEANDET